MSRLLPARPTIAPPEADFAAPSSDDVDELGRSRGSQMTSHTSIIGHGRRKRGGGRWEQHRAPLDAFSRLACQSELELAFREVPTNAMATLEDYDPPLHARLAAVGSPVLPEAMAGATSTGGYLATARATQLVDIVR